MNIVQLQYKLRDMPLSAIQAAANGQFPDIPEMLATMELNRRERMEKAGAKPPVKSIKEQLEEKLSSQPKEQMGLPAMLQQAQQATGEPQQEEVQQAGQPQAPQMAQPQGQPQGQPQQMRMGGVAGLPSGMFKQFCGGGIVAFDEGGDVDESAAETARLRRQEAMATAREYMPQQSAPAAPPVPDDVARANQTVMSAPFVQQASQDIQALRDSGRVTTPAEEMEKRQALLEQYGIRPPKEDELARIESSNAAYEKDRQDRAFYQAMQAASEAARPNIHGKYMPGTFGKSVSSFGLANLDADRQFREANEKAAVAAKEAQRAFKLDNLSDAIAQSRKTEEYEREKNKAVATAAAQMASHGMSAQASIMSRDEEKRYHDMWKDIQDKDLKIKAAQLAATAQSNIPELFRNIDQFQKRYPDIAKSLSPEKMIELSAEMIRERNGIASKAETAHDAHVNSVLKIRQDAKLKATEMERKLLDAARMAKSPDQEKIRKLEESIKAKEDAIDRDNPFPPAPKGGIASILNPGAPAPAANAPAANVQKGANQKVYVDNNGKVIQAPNP